MFETPSTRDVTLGRFLCRMRTQAGVSQGDLSKALGEDPGYISRVEYGVRIVDVIEFIRIVEALRRNAERAMRNYIAFEQKSPRRPVELPLLPTF